MKVQNRRWVITGGAGFIGSHLTESLLKKGDSVLVIDNLSTGRLANLESIRASVGSEGAARLEFVQGDVTNEKLISELLRTDDIILHHAALGSVPRSIADPITSTKSNIEGFVTLLQVAKNKGIKRFIFASSSSVYGDDTSLPKREDKVGAPLSPYAVTKRANELFGGVFSSLHGIGVIGLRYFNIFGPRQDPNGAYAAVIPKWISSLMAGERCTINGDGSVSRDFCYVDNVILANLAAASLPEGTSGIFNIACGEGTTLNELYKTIHDELGALLGKDLPEPVYGNQRAGDIKISLADLSNARRVLSYEPVVSVTEGLLKTVKWYFENK